MSLEPILTLIAELIGVIIILELLYGIGRIRGEISQQKQKAIK